MPQSVGSRQIRVGEVLTLDCEMKVSLISLAVLVTIKLSVSHICEQRHVQEEEGNLEVRNNSFDIHLSM